MNKKNPFFYEAADIDIENPIDEQINENLLPMDDPINEQESEINSLNNLDQVVKHNKK